jgi:ATP-dependent exoDNAse (exonuclease V) alpha subunit
LWNAAERSENRRDARVAREFEFALPDELNAEQHSELTREFAQGLADRHGTAIDFGYSGADKITLIDHIQVQSPELPASSDTNGAGDQGFGSYGLNEV